MNTTSSAKSLEYLSVAKQIFNNELECFNNCVEDFQTKELGKMEKHCLEGCMQIKVGQFSTAAIRS